MARRSSGSEIDELYRHVQSIDKPMHLLMVGMPGSGKSSLANVFINGKSGDISGPETDTTEFIKTIEVKANNISFIVHDTKGLDVFDENIESNTEDMKKIASEENCVVVVCIPFDSHLVSHKLALKATNRLSSEIWKKAIIALTNSDKIPKEEQVSMNLKWRKAIEEELKHLNVNESIIQQLKICNTSHTTEAYYENWFQQLLEKVFEIIPNLNGLCKFLLSRVLIEENMPFIKFLWESLKDGIIKKNVSSIAFGGITYILSIIFDMVVDACSSNPNNLHWNRVVKNGIIFVVSVAITLYCIYEEWKKKQKF